MPWPGHVRIAAGWHCSDPVAAGPPCCTPGPLLAFAPREPPRPPGRRRPLAGGLTDHPGPVAPCNGTSQAARGVRVTRRRTQSTGAGPRHPAAYVVDRGPRQPAVCAVGQGATSARGVRGRPGGHVSPRCARSARGPRQPAVCAVGQGATSARGVRGRPGGHVSPRCARSARGDLTPRRAQSAALGRAGRATSPPEELTSAPPARADLRHPHTATPPSPPHPGAARGDLGAGRDHPPKPETSAPPHPSHFADRARTSQGPQTLRSDSGPCEDPVTPHATRHVPHVPGALTRSGVLVLTTWMAASSV